jgi:hypothetical protein
VPLSEDEQRILTEIEQNLYASDPALARDIADTTLYSVAYRHLKRGVVGFVLGLVFAIATLSVSFLLSFVGVALMFASALAVERNARRMGKAGMDQLTRSVKAAGLRNQTGGTKMRDRFRRDDDAS